MIAARRLAVVAICVGCQRSAPAPLPGASGSASLSPTSTVIATAAVSASASAAPAAAPRMLDGARVTRLSLRDARTGRFGASIDLDRARREVDLRLAMIDAPRAYRRAAAFGRLAEELGIACARRSLVVRLTTGELGAMLEGDRAALSFARDRAVIENDGTIEALIVTPGRADASWDAPSGRSIALPDSAEAKRLAGWAAFAEASQAEPPGVVRDYVEMLVLDYLAANLVRRTVATNDAGRLVLDASDLAFPPVIEPTTLAGMLGRLRTVARFPKPLVEHLRALDRPRADALFASGEFEDRLIAPRSIALMMERRAEILALAQAAPIGGH